MALPQQFLSHPFSIAKTNLFLLPLLYAHFRNSPYFLFVPNLLPTQVARETYSANFIMDNVESLKGLFSPTHLFSC